MRIFRLARSVLVAGTLAGLLALNIATIAFSSVSMLVAGAYEAVTGATSVVGSMKRNLDQKTKKVASLSDEVGRKNRRIASLSNDVAQLKKSQIVSYRGSPRKLSYAVKDTAQRVSRRTAAMATRNAGSVVAGGVPIAGIAVVVGVTAWDLKDSCGTMEDLQELELAFNPDQAVDPEVSKVCGMKVPDKEDVLVAVMTSPKRAWEAAKAHMPDLPELEMPKWPFWN